MPGTKQLPSVAGGQRKRTQQASQQRTPVTAGRRRLDVGPTQQCPWSWSGGPPKGLRKGPAVLRPRGCWGCAGAPTRTLSRPLDHAPARLLLVLATAPQMAHHEHSAPPAPKLPVP